MLISTLNTMPFRAYRVVKPEVPLTSRRLVSSVHSLACQSDALWGLSGTQVSEKSRPIDYRFSICFKNTSSFFCETHLLSFHLLNLLT